jgi:hypothetical protein
MAYLYKFEAGGKGWVYQTTITSTYDVASAEQLVKDGARFFILVANGHAARPFNGTTAITLEVRVDVKTGGYPAGLGQAEVIIWLDADLVLSCLEGTTASTKKWRLSWDLYTDGKNYPPVTWTGRNFTLNSTKQANGNEDTYTLKFDGQVDAKGTAIVSWSVDYTETHVSTSYRKETHYAFTLLDIPNPDPANPSFVGPWYYLLRGAMTGHLTGFKHSVNTTYPEALKRPPQTCSTSLTAADLASTAWYAWSKFEIVQ